ncbi:hypothetical protein KGF54_005608 [Candida jiufengensis]|uniref:uncharacterized protein n=1 Tax=Candida jiufengensis TaxID=497108 RepID=UPI0022246FDD|nr:uncharacterized protein KGF54_005608 [Candida jiufengensis]KAI5949373.1 hypothetical protein KGF54_005608 [Candida jiufengensis]
MFDTDLNQKLKNYQFILGSTSPRRQEILQNNLGINEFISIGSNFAEDLEKHDKSPLEYVQLTSKHKAEALLEVYKEQYNHNNTIILTCDTVVTSNGKIFEKPITKSEQKKFFDYYVEHPVLEVISALTTIKIVNDNITEYFDHSTTKLRFKPNNHDIINAYIESEEGLEVAGGFKYQQLGCLLFNDMIGDYYNVVGLPILTYDLLMKTIR